MLRVHENRSVFARFDGLSRCVSAAVVVVRVGCVLIPRTRLHQMAGRFRGQIGLYKVGLALWLLSYTDEVAEMFVEGNTLAMLCEVVRNVDEKEKVLRVFLACLKVRPCLSVGVLLCGRRC
jgi:hypothetical protein